VTDLDWSLAKARRKKQQERDMNFLANAKDGVFIFAVLLFALLSLGVAG